MKMQIETYSLPAYWASYLINGDSSGMEDTEQAECDAFLSGLPYGWSCVDVSEESDFRHSNDAGTLAGDCADYSFIRETPPPRRTLERFVFDLLENADHSNGFTVTAYELTNDGGGWSVNSPFKLGTGVSLPAVLEMARGRWEVYKVNYDARARVSGLSDISDQDNVWELESAQTPFLRIERVDPEREALLDEMAGLNRKIALSDTPENAAKRTPEELAERYAWSARLIEIRKALQP